MGNVDGLPIASQAKSVVQASRGDVDGAWATQDRFTRHCIGAAQLRSAIEVVRGDVNAAAATQRAFLANAGRLLERSEVADAVPVLAQIKAAAHAADGRVEEAAVTQRNFLTRCPVVSQVRSLVDLASGKPQEALETQREFLDFSSRSLDQVPLLGQAKAWLHRSLGDEERATLAYEAATASSRRSLELLTSGINDVFGGSTAAGSSSPPVSMDSKPLSDREIQEHTLCFEIQPEHLQSHRSCPVCMQDFENEELATTLRCFHIFHTSCAHKWLQDHGNCPVCRVSAVPGHSERW